MKERLSVVVIIGLMSACGSPPESAPIVETATTRTANGSDDSVVVAFEEVSHSAGIDFDHVHGGFGEKNFIETMGGGSVLADFDSDGDLDAYLVQSGVLPGTEDPDNLQSELYLNDGKANFTKTELGAGNNGSYGMGAVAADYDNDGFVDIYVLNFGPNRLYRNVGGKGFVDVTLSSGVADPLWSVSGAFADYDNDGLLDLYVVNYVDFTMDNNKWCGRKVENNRAYCHPDVYNGVPPKLYMNNGDGTFRDVTEDGGVSSTVGKGLGVVATDLDDDGDVDLFGANDSTINYVWRNRGDGTFEDWSLGAGAGYNEDGKSQACMGVDAGDFDGDGRFDIFTTNLDFEYNSLYKNIGDMSFTDVSYRSGIVESHLLYVGFGTEFTDFDLDGYLDILVVNGHVIDNVGEMNDTLEYAQPKSLFRNLGGKRFVEVSDGVPALNAFSVSRGLSVGDIDRDGDIDYLVGSNGTRAELFRNDTPGMGHFVSIRTEGRESNRQGIGAKLSARVGDSIRIEEVRAGTSYASSSDPAVTFGLGSATVVDELTIRWPSGQTQVFRDVAANTRNLAVEGEAALRLLQ